MFAYFSCFPQISHFATACEVGNKKWKRFNTT